MKKVIHKSKKRVRPGKLAAAIKKLDKLYTSGLAKEKWRTVEERALIAFVEAHVTPYKQRGDVHLDRLWEIGGVIESKSPNLDVICDTVRERMEEIRDLRKERASRLNYDDMREALQRVFESLIVGAVYESDWMRQVKLALAGAPASDIGAMRRALMATDTGLTDLLRGMDEKTPRPVVMFLWELVHGARNALSSAPGPDKIEERAEQWKLFKDRLTKIYQAVIANDPSSLDAWISDGGWDAVDPDLTEQACNLIMEAISLRAFLAEAEAKVWPRRGKDPSLTKRGHPTAPPEQQGWPTPDGAPYIEMERTVKSVVREHKGDGAMTVKFTQPGTTCIHCGKSYEDHCAVHVIPCCPGKCLGPRIQ